MADQVEPRDDERPAEDTSSDPVARALTEVDAAMAQARAGIPAADETPAVPSDDELAGLERAHEALRSTLDRAERG